MCVCVSQCVCTFVRPITCLFIKFIFYWKKNVQPCMIICFPVFTFLQVYYGECSVEFMDQCVGLGFTNNLKCSTCQELDHFNLGKLKDSCIGCCQDDSSPDAETEVLATAVAMMLEMLTLFRPSNYRGVNFSDPIIFSVWAEKRVFPQIWRKKKTVVFIAFKFCVNVTKCLFLML